MIVKFDYGKNGIPYGDVVRILKDIDENYLDLGLTAQKLTVYMTGYDEDGYPCDIGDANGEEIEYIVRGQPYKRIPKNTVECAKFGRTDQETGEMKITSYLYRRKR